MGSTGFPTILFPVKVDHIHGGTPPRSRTRWRLRLKKSRRPWTPDADGEQNGKLAMVVPRRLWTLLRLLTRGQTLFEGPDPPIGPTDLSTCER